MEWGSCTEL